MDECARCRDLGHSCPGTFEEDGQKICVFCLDLTECPVQRKQRAAKKNTPPDETPPAAGDANSTDRASEVKSEEKMPEPRENSTETAPKMCRRPGCDRKLGSGNTIGLCARHVRWTAPAERTSSAAEKTNGHAHAPGNGVTAKPTNGHATTPAPKNGNGAAAVAEDFLEERLDKLILSFPVSDKAKIVNSWIKGAI
jgi:hypothetical protein